MHLSQENREARPRTLYRVISQKLIHPAVDLLVTAVGMILIIVLTALGWAMLATADLLSRRHVRARQRRTAWPSD